MALFIAGIIVVLCGVSSGVFGLSHNKSPSQQIIASVEKGWSDPYTIFLIGSLILIAAGLMLMLVGWQENKRKLGKRTLWNKLRKNRMFLLLMLPGTIWILIFSYLTMPGILVSFKKLTFLKSNFILNFLNSRWVGLDNLTFFFRSTDFFLITRNSVGYHLLFMVVGMVGCVVIAAIGNELYSKRAVRAYQTIFIFPSFISWVIVSYLVFSILSPEFGTLNSLLKSIGFTPVRWYHETKYWPYFLTFINFWKGAGLGSIYYFAILTGIDPELYQAAFIDGASKWRQFTAITLPGLKMIIVITTILNLGGIMGGGDMGLFWVTTRSLGQGALYKVGATISTYMYNALIETGDWLRASAVGAYQSVVGFVIIVTVNLIARKIDPESSLF